MVVKRDHVFGPAVQANHRVHVVQGTCEARGIFHDKAPATMFRMRHHVSNHGYPVRLLGEMDSRHRNKGT